MNESGHTQAINKKVKAAGVYALKIQTMMNNGVPDCWYSGKKGDLWVEFKHITKLPKREDTAIKCMLSALQENWLNERWREHRKVVVIIGSPDGWIIQTMPGIWTAPISKTEFNLTRNEVVEWIIKQTQG